MQEAGGRGRTVTATLRRVWERLWGNGRISFLTGGITMEWTVSEDKCNQEDWRVEAIDFEHEGAVYVAVFSGPDARKRAHEYAAIKSAQTDRQLSMAS